MKKLFLLLLTAFIMVGFVSAQNDEGENNPAAEFIPADGLSGNIADDCNVKPDSVLISNLLFAEKIIDKEKLISIKWEFNEINYPGRQAVIETVVYKEVDGASHHSESINNIV